MTKPWSTSAAPKATAFSLRKYVLTTHCPITRTTASTAVLLQAYALYRLNQLQDALNILAGNLPDTPGKALLEAQLHHRLGNYAAAIATYNKLVQQHKVSFCSACRCNCC